MNMEEFTVRCLLWRRKTMGICSGRYSSDIVDQKTPGKNRSRVGTRDETYCAKYRISIELCFIPHRLQVLCTTKIVPKGGGGSVRSNGDSAGFGGCCVIISRAPWSFPFVSPNPSRSNTCHARQVANQPRWVCWSSCWWSSIYLTSLGPTQLLTTPRSWSESSKAPFRRIVVSSWAQSFTYSPTATSSPRI